MICNILAQKKQYGRGFLPQSRLSMKYLTTVMAACLVALSSTTEAQTTGGKTSQDVTYSEMINVGGGPAVVENPTGDTYFYSPDHTVGVWVNGSSFTNYSSDESLRIFVTSPTIFQIGGSSVYNGTPPQGTLGNNRGGTIRFSQLSTQKKYGTNPDLSVIVLGSSEADSIFSAKAFNAVDGDSKSIDIFIDGANATRKTGMEVTDGFTIQRDPISPAGKLSFTLQNSAVFSVGGDAYFTLSDPQDSFVAKNNASSDGILVSKNLVLYNNTSPLTDLTKESEQAIIKDTNLKVGETLSIRGGEENWLDVKDTFLQIINSPGVNTEISAQTLELYSMVPENTTTLLLGRGAKLNVPKIYVHAHTDKSTTILMLGDPSSTDADYGVTTNFILMDGPGQDKLVFNNAHSGNSSEKASFPIYGKGTIEIQTGRTTFTKKSGYSGQTVIGANSALILKTISSAGTSDISNSGELSFSGAQGTIQNNISGAGSVFFEDDANVSVLDNAAWTGPTNINRASVSLGASDSPAHMASSAVNISHEGKLNGFGSINGSLNNAGFFMIGDDENASPSDFNIGRNIVNSGEIHLGNGKSAGSSLIVHGNYTGNNGLLEFNTILNGDNDSPTDKLVVKGNTSGNTSVRVNALGGSGKQTNTGIELIHVDGASEGSFTQKGRIVAGAYDYNLERGTGDNNKNWYLKSHPTKPKGQHGRTGSDDSSSPLDQDSTPLYRPEAGAYVGNSAVVQTLFSSRLHDRIGDLWYADPYAENNQLTGMWVKQRGNYNTWRESSGQTRNRTQMYATQLGADVASWTSNGENRFLVGWVAGYGHGRTKSRSIHTGYHAIGTVDGLNVGITGTWYQDGIHHEGMYVDTWLTYGWFDNKVKGQGIETEKYHSRGFTGSLETGYTWKLGEHVTEKGCDIGWFLQPQAQVIWSGVKTDTFHEHNGTSVKSKGRNNIQTRLGARLMLDTNLRSYANGIGGTQLFIEGNWVHNTKSHGVEMNGTVLNQEGARHLGEIKVGLNGKPTDNLHIWTNVTARAGTHHYRDLTGMIGLKYSF